MELLDRSDFWQKLLSVVMTIMVIVLSYLAASVNNMSKAQQQASIALAILTTSVETHNLEAGKYIAQIEDHEKRLMIIEQLHINNSMTKDQILEAIDRLKNWVDKNYQKR